jgi:DNA invertase Pin-like site-specific DNA recombinase
MSKVVGYTRVSTEEQGRSGLGLEAQADAIRTAYKSVEVVEEIASAARASNRPVLQQVLRDLRRGDTLVTAKLDRLARNTRDFCDILDQAERQGWALVVLDLGLDTSQMMGRAMAQMLAVFGELERGMIADRTRRAWAAKRARGDTKQVSPAVRKRILDLRAKGMSADKIADELNGLRVKALGTRWHGTTVKRILRAEAKLAA